MILGRHFAKPALFAAAALALAALAAFASLWWLASASRYAHGDPDDARQVALGKKVYADNCASCHGAQLEGQADWRLRKPDGRLPAPPHDFHGHTWRHPDDELFGMIKEGMAAYAPAGYQTDMKGYAELLSDAEIWAVIAFIKKSWPPEFRTYQQKVTGGAHGRDQ